MSADLTSALVNFKSAEMASQVQYAVAAKMLQIANSQNAAILQLVEAAAQGMDTAVADVSQATADMASGVDVYA